MPRRSSAAASEGDSSRRIVEEAYLFVLGLGIEVAYITLTQPQWTAQTLWRLSACFVVKLSAIWLFHGRAPVKPPTAEPLRGRRHKSHPE
jgi:hypothetical protein